LTTRLIVVQAPGPEGNGTMGKIDAPYLIWRRNKSGTSRHYFCQDDRKHGWAQARLGNCPPARCSWRAYS
jgi:hypothetical protein